MHDPSTVAFKIRWLGLTIWHEDPEKDGSDDSCGWSWPKANKLQRERLEWLGKDEARDPWLTMVAEKRPTSPADAEALLRGAILVVARACDVRMPFDEAAKLAAVLLHHPGDNLRSFCCFLPGYHSNSTEERSVAWARESEAKRSYLIIARHVLDWARPWWRHPRWHIHHWRLQFSWLLDFKRWAFSRCIRCGKRFSWGYCPTSTWSAPGPGWFRNEGAWHNECDDSSKPCAGVVVQ